MNVPFQLNGFPAATAPLFVEECVSDLVVGISMYGYGKGFVISMNLKLIAVLSQTDV